MQVPFLDGLLANEQHAFLENPLNGWRQVSRVLAQDNALHGKPTLVTRPNPTGHGHIAVVRPEAINGDVYIAQAGRENFLIGRLQRGFGALSVTYWIKE